MRPKYLEAVCNSNHSPDDPRRTCALSHSTIYAQHYGRSAAILREYIAAAVGGPANLPCSLGAGPSMRR